jgi:uncharacterized protein YijF (DUF1287 family)
VPTITIRYDPPTVRAVYACGDLRRENGGVCVAQQNAEVRQQNVDGSQPDIDVSLPLRRAANT